MIFVSVLSNLVAVSLSPLWWLYRIVLCATLVVLLVTAVLSRTVCVVGGSTCRDCIELYCVRCWWF